MAEVRRIGNYELLEKLGQGGMGTVYKARQLSMDRVVALKILPPSFAKRKEFIERFFREARASAKLNHPNIVNGIDVGQENGLYFFAMEFVDGSSVNTLLKHGAIKEFRCAEIGHDIAQALSHAHQNGILHRDIKPDNILIDSNGVAKLCDLGLARVDSESEEQKSLTQQGQAVGTPHYISPEQAKGQRDLDVRTDLYSLGATLYHMATGRQMYDGPTSVVIMTKHLTDKAPAPTNVNPAVSKHFTAVLARLLTKDRADRYVSAQHLADDLKRVQNGLAPQNAELPASKWPFAGGDMTAAHAPVKRVAAVSAVMDRSRVTRSVRGTGRYSSVGATLAPLLIAGALGIGALVMFSGRKNPRPEETTQPAARPQETQRPVASAASTPSAPAPAIPSAVRTPPKTTSSGSAPSNLTASPRNTNQDIIGVVPPSERNGDADETPVVATQEPARTSPGVEKEPVDNPALAANARPKLPETQVLAQIDPKTTTAPSSAPKAIPGPELTAEMEKVPALVAESKFLEAADLFKPLAASSSKLDDFDRKIAKIHLEGLGGLHSLKQRVISAIKASPGKFEATGVFKKNVTGKMMSADERAIHVADPKVKAAFPLEWKRMVVEDLQKLGATILGTMPTDAQLGLAVLAYGQNQDQLARVRLQNLKLPEAEQLAAAIDARDEELKAKKRAELNAGAEKAYQEAEAALFAGKSEDVAKHAATLLSTYAQSEFVQARMKDIEALTLTAKALQTEGVVLEKGNVALEANGATVERRRHRELIDGDTTNYTGGTGFAMVEYPGEINVMLAKPYILREIRLLLWDREERFYRYNVEVSVDGQNFVQVGGDHSTGEWRSWQTLSFAPRVVKFIKLRGLYNSANGSFHCVELEAYGIPPEQPAVPKYPSKPAEK